MTTVVLLVVLAPACTGLIEDPAGASAIPGSGSRLDGNGPGDLDVDALGAAGIHRLSRVEVRDTIEDLLGIELPPELIELLPPDAATPFDNDETQQVASAALLEGVKAIGDRAAAIAMADPSRRAAIVGCAPLSAADEACFRSFLERFGRRALRRPLDSDEVDELTTTLMPFASDQDDFYVAVELALRALLQHPELLHRVEIGVPVPEKPGVFRLTSWELATRLSYLLWGAPPDDELLDLAAADRLESGEDVRAAAERMLSEPRARQRIARFHAMWLGYDGRGGDPLRDAMRAETDASVERIVFDEHRPWTDLLTLDETFVDAPLAEHYGLPSPGDAPGWVPYDEGRAGILSQGMLLANGAKFGDTSPTLRGQFIRSRLFCQPLPPPPPDLMVNTDEPPGGADSTACKPERYASHRSSPGCAGCHALVDPIGFGLENYDTLGRFRTHEVDNPECEIAGDGEVVGVGRFHGPGELGALLAGAPAVQSCLIRQLYRFAVGRPETEADEATLEILDRGFDAVGHRLDALILDSRLVAGVSPSPGAQHRRRHGGDAMSYRLGRRAFLAGVGGTVVSLPLLDAMTPAARALDPTPPKRFVVMYAGTSLHPSRVTPASEGTGYALTRGLVALAGRDHASLVPSGLSYNSTLSRTFDYDSVIDDVAVVTGLKIPWDTGGGVPSGGRVREFHASTVGPTLSGMRATERNYDARGESSDQVAKRSLAGDSRFASLEYRAQVKSYRGETGQGDRARMSWSGSGGSVVANDPIVSPRIAYDQLFRGFTPDDPAEAAQRRLLLEQDRSVLDLVRGGADRLMGRLGSQDRARMERYFDELRALERSINELPDDPVGACSILPDPGEDPPVHIRACTEDPGNDCHYAYIDGWGNEERRARLFCDLMHMALACDLTRVSTLMLTFGQSFLNMNETLAINLDLHEIGHNADPQNGTADVLGWHLKHFSYLVDKLRSTPEAGGTVLDNTVLVLLTEGGFGQDPEGGSSSSAHSSENMTAIIAGGGSSLRTGQHVAARDAHPAQVLITALNAVGVETSSLGEVTGTIGALLP